MKTAIKIILLLGVTGYLSYAAIELSHTEKDYVCEGLEVSIEDSTSSTFISKDYIKDILAEAKVSPEGCNISTINLDDIKRKVGQGAYIDSVLCYFTPEHNLCVSVIPRVPIMHVMADNREDFYMDAKGNCMPARVFNLDLPLFTGHVNAQVARKSLIPVAEYLLRNTRWNNDVEQINVEDASHIFLIPSTGNFLIAIGDCTRMDEKMHRLDKFLNEGLPQAGWNKYGIIDVSYDGQVVCTKNNNNI